MRFEKDFQGVFQPSVSFENYKIYLLLDSLNFRLKKLRGKLGMTVNFNYFSRLRVQSDLIKSFEIIK